jgi:hypothetical protein
MHSADHGLKGVLRPRSCTIDEASGGLLDRPIARPGASSSSAPVHNVPPPTVEVGDHLAILDHFRTNQPTRRRQLLCIALRPKDR